MSVLLEAAKNAFGIAALSKTYVALGEIPRGFPGGALPGTFRSGPLDQAMVPIDRLKDAAGQCTGLRFIRSKGGGA